MERSRIVVLDGYTLNPGDLSWEPLEALGELTVHPRTPPELVVPRCAGAPIVLTNKVPIGSEAFERLPDLRYVGVLATGYNIVDVGEARRRGIVVTNVPEYGTRSVAQLTFALILELAHRVGRHSELCRTGSWSASPDFCFWEGELVELEGLTLGLVGYGRIGRATAALGRAFGMGVLAHDPAVAEADVPLVPLDELLRRADVVSLHCPLTPQNRGLIDRRALSLMKPTAWLVNTARGPLVDERDLAEALAGGRIAAAAVDVLAVEPPPEDNPLLSAPNCVVTPHIAWATRAARRRLLDAAAENVRSFLQGAPRNTVA
ncbi:MAG: D-2-hydroxyacid dehydrogenase [Fimbriimonadales bacterium]|nr:D-2-hydroxyacid dehydrogenase [Fimbriimonadales bacterium]